MVPRFALSALFVLLFLSAVPSPAQQQPPRDTVYLMSPVIITATQARERETPVTFTDLKARDIRERYSMQDVPVLLSDLPSITTYSENGNGIGYNYVNLRGFDQRRISVMVNGIPQNDPEDHGVYWIDFPDLLGSTSLLQVQRGAGSAFYGPAAIGGSINLVTNPFSGEPGITLESDLGFQQFRDSSRSLALNTRKVAASFVSGLVDGRYMFYGRLGKITSDGYRTNAWVDLDSYFFGAVRIDSTMTTRFHFFGGPLTDGLAYTGLPKFVGSDPALRRQNLASWGLTPGNQAFDYAVPRRPQESEAFSQPHYELIHEWRLSPAVTLYNTFFYYTGDGYFDYDASWADTTMLRLGTAYGIPVQGNPTDALVRAYVGNRQGGWLPRVEIDHGTGTLTLGGELRIHRSTHWGKISYAGNLPANFDPDYHFYEYNGVRDIFSVYAHEMYRITGDLTFMGSLQMVRNRYGIRNEKYLGNQFDVPYFFANPRFGLNYNMSDEASAYVSLGYTSREPTMRDLYAAEDSYFGATPEFRVADTTGGRVRYDFADPLAKPERLLDVEIGGRYTSQSLQGTLSLYWMEFADELVKSGRVDIFGQPVTGNAPRSRHLGVELEGAAALPWNLRLSGNVAMSYNRLIQYSIINDAGVMVTLDGNPVAGFPDLLGNLRLTYRDDRFTGSLAVKYVGPFYTDNFKNADNRNDAYTVCNAEFLYSLPAVAGTGIELRAEVRNIFNALYFLGGEGNAFFPAAERNFVFGAKLRI